MKKVFVSTLLGIGSCFALQSVYADTSKTDACQYSCTWQKYFSNQQGTFFLKTPLPPKSTMFADGIWVRFTDFTQDKESYFRKYFGLEDFFSEDTHDFALRLTANGNESKLYLTAIQKFRDGKEQKIHYLYGKNNGVRNSWDKRHIESVKENLDLTYLWNAILIWNEGKDKPKCPVTPREKLLERLYGD